MVGQIYNKECIAINYTNFKIKNINFLILIICY